MKRRKLGEILQEGGKISADELQKLFAEQQSKMVRLGELIRERGLVDKASLVNALEEVSRVQYLDCSTLQCDEEAVRALPKSMAMRLGVLPVRVERNRIVVAMVEPQNIATIDEIRFTTGKDVSPRLGFRDEIMSAIVQNYDRADGKAANGPAAAESDGPAAADTPDMEFISTSSRQANREAIQAIQIELNQRKTPAVRLVTQLIQGAMNKQASDIHIEPQAGATIVRIRVDGVLRELENVPRNVHNSLISRIKILSDMDIGERRAPQDGRFMVSTGKRKVDVRVSTLPTQFGEKVVMRLLDATAPMLSFAELGFSPEVGARINQLLALPQGMLLVTGPTGSGKSTTLYSALNALRKPAVNIVTVEDPVEYGLAGINQVHVNTRAGLTFASCLRSILRQDPNVIMVGEIRDLETAEIAMKAAQTGHLVLSTLHTNDSISAVARLLDLGIPEYMIASSITGILAQRLLRKLCACQVIKRVTSRQAERLAALGWMPPPDQIASPKGCEACDHTGYKGRVGIYELLFVDESIRGILRSGFQLDLLRSAARAAGMVRMQEDALAKLRAGITTLEEIDRVVLIETASTTVCENCRHDLPAIYLFCPFCGTRREAPEAASRNEQALKSSSGVLTS